MNTINIRKTFLNFFENNKHKILNESPLTLENDDTLLFTNSGMAQFKNIFMGHQITEYKNIATAQKCIRVGGKHNDLKNIGKSTRHHTLFEMLGNFSFMNNSKKDTIHLAWIFLTNILKLDKEKLFISIHKNDIETINIWKSYIKIPNKNIILGNSLSNFWTMNNTGPCGFCSEIFYNTSNNSIKNKLLEIWNLVFIEFYKNKNNKLIKLDKTHIDTGMGLERISSIIQNTYDTYKIDIYNPLINKTLDILNIKTKNILSTRIITDHIRTCIFLINEGIIPSNEGRGYIIRKLIRRAIVHKKKLNVDINLYKLINDYINIINKNYSDTKFDNNTIKQIIKSEENKFEKTIEHGFNIFNKILYKNNNILTGENLFLLYDTYGFPIELINEISNEKKITINIKDFEKEMTYHKDKNRKIRVKKDNINLLNDIPTIFVGYTKLKITTSIIKIIKNNSEENIIKNKEKGIIITTETIFFAEKGGQIGDKGIISYNDNVFIVSNTLEKNNIYMHYGEMESGELKVKNIVVMDVNEKIRKKIANNHTATHLLNITLQKLLGNHVKQSGSVIKDKYFTFDFTHYKQLSIDEIKKIEIIINNHIYNNESIITNIISSTYSDKNINNINKNKYKDKIRLVTIGNNISKELCAGTHVNNTSEIKIFKIIKENSIGSNIRRIEAITEEEVYKLNNNNELLLNDIFTLLNTNKDNTKKYIIDIILNNKLLKKENTTLNIKLLKDKIKNTLPIFIENNIKLFSINNDKQIYNIKLFKNILGEYKNSIFILYIIKNKTLYLNINTTIDLKPNITAVTITNFLKEKLKCKGGGKSYIANIIINNYYNISEIITHIHSYIKNNLTKQK